MAYGRSVGEEGLSYLQGAGEWEFGHAPVNILMNIWAYRQHKLDLVMFLLLHLLLFLLLFSFFSWVVTMVKVWTWEN